MVAYVFAPIAFENLGVPSVSARQLLSDLGRRLTDISGESRETSYLFQKFSALVQRFNAVLLHDSLPRAVASLEEAEGHQHLAGGDGSGCEQMSPLPLKRPGDRDPRNFFCTFLIQNPAFLCILWLRKWALPVFLSRDALGKRRLLGEGQKSRPKAKSGVGFLDRGSKGVCGSASELPSRVRDGALTAQRFFKTFFQHSGLS